jgi:hypothetical protein
MKKILSLPLVFLSLFLFNFCCEESKLEDLQNRLDDFRNILPEELKVKFDSGEYQDVVAGLDSLLSTDFTFKQDYEKLKDKEAINVFSTQELVDFYRQYFVEELNRLKKKKE